MRILHLIGWYFPDSVGGTEVYVAELARRQRARGFDVAIAAPQVAAALHHYEWDGTTVWRYPLAQPDAAFATILDRTAPDVVHVHSIVTALGLPQMVTARRRGARIVFTAHLPALGYVCTRGTLLHWGTEPCDGILRAGRCTACALQVRGVPRPLAPLLATAAAAIGPRAARLPDPIGGVVRVAGLVTGNARRQRELFDAVDWFVALNRQAARIVIDNGAPPERVVLNRLGHAMAHVAAKPGPDVAPTGRPVTVGFVGRLHEIKGVDVLIQAVARLPASTPLRVHLCGDLTHAEAPGRMAAMLADAARDPRVTVSGALDHAGVARTLLAFDVLCVPSRSYENGPTVALEAQALGTPVIGSALGGLSEIVEDGVTGRLFPVGDWRALRTILEEVATDPSIVDRWRAALPCPRTMAEVEADYLPLYGAPARHGSA